MFNIPKDADFDDDFDDAALEDELQAIISGNHPPNSSRATANVKQERPQTASHNAQSRPPNYQQKAPVQTPYDLDAMMGNLNLENDDDDEEFDENDPELSKELAAFLGDDDLPSYSPAKQPAPRTASVPPSVPSVPSPLPPAAVAKPSRPAPFQTPPSSCIQLKNSHFLPEQQLQQPEQRADPKSQIEQLIRLKDEYKTLALNAKRANEIENAKAYLKKMRDVETVLESMSEGRPSAGPVSSSPLQAVTGGNSKPPAEEPKQAGSLLEELEQRRQKIESVMQKEQSANNVPIVKMMTRVIKQYDSAIKACKAGRKFDYESLPPAPGFGELPLERFNKPAGAGAQPNVQSNASVPPSQPEPNKPASGAQSKPDVQPNQSGQSKIRQLEKQRDEYKMLALNAKKQNDLENAKLYLLKMKETNTLIESLSAGQQSIQKVETPRPAAQQPHPTAVQPRSILGELEQRKTKFESVLQREQGNASRVRVIGRVLKQYETAINACKSGKQFDYVELPIPPGFEQLPAIEKEEPPKPSEQKPSSQPPQQPTGKPPFKRAMSVNNRQLDYLLQRQKLFKEAAVESNNKGDTTQALDYLRKAKGFQPLITAVENGLPIDVSNIPIPPQLDTDDFVMVTSESSGALSGVDLEKEEHYRKLELELEKQIGLCSKNKVTA